MKFDLLKPKRIFLASVFFPVILLFPVSGWAITIQEIPNPRKESGGWVTDMADILNDETEAQINQMISELETKTGKEMAVVTVPTTSPAASPKSFATELFNYWGIGKKGQDNGVLFLISVGDRRVEIETGYGIEAILPDAKVGNIIKTQIIPYFKKADFAGGTLAGSKALIVVLKSDQASSGNTLTIPNNIGGWGVSIGIIFILIVGATVYQLIFPEKVFIAPTAPTGYIHRHKGKYRLKYLFLCANCQKPMKKVENSIVQSSLKKPEKIAQLLGSVKFQGWRCSSCNRQRTGNNFRIVAQESLFSKFCRCPQCNQLTMIREEKIIKEPTYFRSGTRLITKECQGCSYHDQYEVIIPERTHVSSGRSSSGGGSSSSSGGFGGGSSGGGGAGGSW